MGGSKIRIEFLFSDSDALNTNNKGSDSGKINGLRIVISWNNVKECEVARFVKWPAIVDITES